MRKFNGNRLRAMREQRCYSLSQVARLMKLRGREITKQAIAHWESGNNAPGAENLVALSELFDVPIDVFFAPRSNYVFVRRDYDGLTELIEKFSNHELLEVGLPGPELPEPSRKGRADISGEG